MQEKKTIILTRHGESQANREDRFAGRMDFPLTGKGRSQAEELAARLAPLAPAKVVCGPSLRTRETAAIIARNLALPLPPAVDPAFDDISIPHWEGLSKAEIRTRFRGQYPTWREAPQRFCLPGCETVAQVRDRAVAGVLRLAEEEGPVVVVTHLVVARALLMAAAGAGVERFRDFSLANGEFALLTRDEEGKLATGRVN